MEYKEETHIASPLSEVWAFFERPDAFEKLNPPWAHVKLLHKTGGLEAGAEVHLQLPLSIKWILHHVDYKPGSYFIDQQVKGPFLYWRHYHGFRQDGTHKTILEDHVTFSLPLPRLLNPLLGWAIQKQLKRLFAYRKAVLNQLLSSRSK